MSLNDKQWAFIRDFSTFDPGMPRAMGLILGYLLVCEPVEQSSLNMQNDLSLSAGSVSTMISMLVDSGLVTKTKKLGDRRHYYMVAENSWQRVIEMRLDSIKKMRSLVAKAMKVSPENYRLQEVFKVYDLVAVDLEEMIGRLNAQKGARI